MTIDTIELRRLARNATPGPWVRVFSDKKTVKQFKTISGGDVTWIVDCLCPGSSLSERVAAEHVCERGESHFADVEPDHWRAGADASFIAAANPATVLALLDEVELLRANYPHNEIRSAFKAATSIILSIGKISGAEDQGFVERTELEDRINHLVRIEAAARNLLDADGRATAERIGNGNISDGIRIALAMAKDKL